MRKGPRESEARERVGPIKPIPEAAAEYRNSREREKERGGGRGVEAARGNSGAELPG